MPPDTLLDVLAAAVRSEATQRRYWSRVRHVAGFECLWWVGAISGRGHGRLWLDDSVVVIAHRYAWALSYGVESLSSAPQLAHQCDNPLCQNVTHLRLSTPRENRREWAARRHQIGGPLRDTRGAVGRARAARAALLAGLDLRLALSAGEPEMDQVQGALW